jgi:hypothetical protein
LYRSSKQGNPIDIKIFPNENKTIKLKGAEVHYVAHERPDPGYGKRNNLNKFSRTVAANLTGDIPEQGVVTSQLPVFFRWRKDSIEVFGMKTFSFV